MALMDDALVRTELMTAEAEMSRLRADLEAQRSQVRLDTAAVMRRFILNEESARLDFMDRLVQIETDKIDLERLRVELSRLERLAGEGLVDRAAYDTARLRHEALKTRLEESVETMALARRQREESMGRRTEYEQRTSEGDIDEVLKPFREAIRVQEARIGEILERRKLLVLRAPISGRVSRIFAWAGVTVSAGQPILAISGAQSTRVVAYVDEASVNQLQTGGTAEIRSSYSPKPSVRARVLRIGRRIEEVPLEWRRNALFPQWGLPVVLGDIPSDVFVPGETLEVRFLGDAERSGASRERRASLAVGREGQ